MKNNLKYALALTIAANLVGCTFLNSRKEAATEVLPKEVHETIKQEETQPTPTAEGKADDSLYTSYEIDKASLQKAPAKREKQKNAGRKNDVSLNDQELYAPSENSEKKRAAPSASISGGIATQGKGGMGYRSAESQAYYYPSIPVQESREVFDRITENSFHKSITDPLSTFSIDVDTASYSKVRQMINQGITPPKDAVRIEEMINYFDYDYSEPTKGAFAVNMEVAPAIWNKKNRIVRIGIKGKEMQTDKRPASNLVFLIDVSGSMNTPNRLPLVKSALGMLVEKLGSNDKISIVVYAGAAGLVLSPTSGSNKMQILRALDNLHAGGSTNGGGGIELAYRTATDNFIKGGVNRVILATDGDFNVGTTSREALTEMVERNGKKNIYLTILGFGMGNYKDGLMETLSNKGNGNYAYIDSQLEARKVMVEQLSGTLVTIAKDVKIQVEFNPKFVESYRLVGYENRVLKNEDFNNDAKDAGDIGAGHTVTALYEIVPAGTSSANPKVDALKYQNEEYKRPAVVASENDSNELLTLKIRYKRPDGDVSTKLEFPLMQKDYSFADTTNSFKFASAVALFGMLLRNSEHIHDGSYSRVIEIASQAKGADKNSYRQEFIEMVRKVEGLKMPHQARIWE